MVNSSNCGLNGRIISESEGLIQLALYPTVSGSVWMWLVPFDLIKHYHCPSNGDRDIFFYAAPGNPNRQVPFTSINGMLCDGSKKELSLNVTVECVWMDGAMPKRILGGVF